MFGSLSSILIGVVLFGVLTIILGYVSGFIMKQFNGSKVPAECADWNKNHIMEKSLFITGMLVYLTSYGYTYFMSRQ
jgi:hypothetical protein